MKSNTSIFCIYSTIISAHIRGLYCKQIRENRKYYSYYQNIAHLKIENSFHLKLFSLNLFIGIDSRLYDSEDEPYGQICLQRFQKKVFFNVQLFGRICKSLHKTCPQKRTDRELMKIQQHDGLKNPPLRVRPVWGNG